MVDHCRRIQPHDDAANLERPRLQLHSVEVEQLDAGIGISRVVDVDNRYGVPIITRVMGHE
jgi:hypothetical protein